MNEPLSFINGNSSIWLSLALLTVFGFLSALAMLLGANTAHLLCHPLREPLARPDILSVCSLPFPLPHPHSLLPFHLQLADRLVTLYGIVQSPSPSPSATKSFNQIFTANRRPSDLVRGCAQGK